MKRRIISLVLGACMVFSMLHPLASMAAQEDGRVVTFEEAVGALKEEKGMDVMPQDWTDGIRPEGFLSAEVMETEEAFGKAVRLKTTELGSAAWDAQLWVDVGSGINRGDTIFFGFKMRGIESVTNKESTAVFVNTRLRPDKNTSVNLNAEGYVDEEWQQFYMAAQSPVGSSDNGGFFVFHLGLALQTVEIADLFVITYGQQVSLSELPIMRKTYEGMEDGARWREEAMERIEEIRKADLMVTVKDEWGNPIPEVLVEVNQTRHSYGFGTIVNAASYETKMSKSQKEKYLDIVKMMSNRSGFENDMKMNFIEDSAPQIEFFLNWFEENDIDVRGHALIYGDFKRLPANRQEELKQDPQALRQFTLEHITKYVTKYKDRIYNWDVVNENMTSNEFTEALGDEMILEWFQAAREADERVKLTLNDFGILSRDTGHQDYHYELLKYLVDQEAPVTTVGIQGHVSLIAPEEILKILDRFGELGKEIEITEFTFAEKDEELQAKFTRDFLTAVFSHPSTTSVVTWGFWEGEMYEPDAAMFRRDFSMKPNGQVWMDLIYDQWWTSEEGETDQNGGYGTRAFMGDHKVRAVSGDLEGVFDVELGSGGNTLELIRKDGKLVLKDEEDGRDLGFWPSSAAASSKAKEPDRQPVWKQNEKGWWLEYGNGSYPKSEWVKLKQDWYYFNEEGYLSVGWKQIGEAWYYLNGDGRMIENNWVFHNGRWYYLGEGGIMSTGWVQWKKEWYYTDLTTGAMWTDTAVQIGTDGRMGK